MTIDDYSVHASHPSTVKIKCLSSFPLQGGNETVETHQVGKGRGMLLFFFGGLSENREPTGSHVLVNHCPSPPTGPFEGFSFSNALKHSSESKSAGDFHHFDGINMD